MKFIAVGLIPIMSPSTSGMKSLNHVLPVQSNMYVGKHGHVNLNAPMYYPSELFDFPLDLTVGTSPRHNY